MNRKGATSIIIILIIILIIGFGIWFFFYFKDYQEVRKIKSIDQSLENFYNTNDRYPNYSEFQKQFSYFSSSSKEYYLSDSYTAPQTFEIRYPQLFEHTFAIGAPMSVEGFYRGYYEVRPCHRWPFDHARLSDPYVWDIPSSFEADFNNGTVSYVHYDYKGNIVSSMTLLTGLIKPRLFEREDADKFLYVTNGNSIYSYKINTDANKKILNVSDPKVIDAVPSGCSSLL